MEAVPSEMKALHRAAAIKLTSMTASVVKLNDLGVFELEISISERAKQAEPNLLSGWTTSIWLYSQPEKLTIGLYRTYYSLAEERTLCSSVLSKSQRKTQQLDCAPNIVQTTVEDSRSSVPYIPFVLCPVLCGWRPQKTMYSPLDTTLCFKLPSSRNLQATYESKE